MKSYSRSKFFLASSVFLSLFPLSTVSLFSQTDDYNIKIGDLLMDFSVHVGYSYNDNVTAVADHTPDFLDPTILGPREDFILSYGANVGLDWQITDNNTLGVNLGLNYNDYQDLDYMDSSNTFFSVDPTSEIDFTVLLGFIEARVYDRFGYTVDGSNSVFVDTVDGQEVLDGEDREILRGRSISTRVDRYAAWENEMGVEFLAVLNPVEVSLKISQYNLMPDDNDEDEFVTELGGTFQRPKDRWEFTRRSEFMINGEVYYPLGNENGVGIFAQYSKNNYKRDILADSTGWQVGLLADWALGERTAIEAVVGYDMRDYDEANTLRYLSDGTFADVTEGKNVFYSLKLLNLLGETFNHKLSITRLVDFGRVTNEQVSTTIAWDFLYEGIRRVDVTGGVQWVNAKDSGPVLYAEDYDLFMATLGFEIELGEHLVTNVNFAHLNKDSNDDDRDFVQNKASITLLYDF